MTWNSTSQLTSPACSRLGANRWMRSCSMCFLPRGRSNLLARAKRGPLQPLCLVPTVLPLRNWRSMNRPMSAQSAVLSERELCGWIYYPGCPSANASPPSNAARRNRSRKPTLTRRIFRCSGPGFPGSRLYSTTSRFPHSMTTSKRSVFEHSSIISGGTAVSVATSFDVGPRLAPDCHGNRRRSIRSGFNGSHGPTASGRSVQSNRRACATRLASLSSPCF